jgi:hypothetical protein
MDIKMTPDEIVKARKKATFKKYKFNDAGATPAEFCIADDAQLKLLGCLNKKLYEICPHKTYPEQRNRIDCTLCIMECMSELEKILKDGK